MSTTLFWHRRDLRLDDNAGLYHALRSGNPVQPIFIFDTTILDKLPKQDKRVEFIHRSLQKLDQAYRNHGASLRIYHGNPTELWPLIWEEWKPSAVFTNHDYEPYALQRDQQIGSWLLSKQSAFYTFKDQCIFEKDEVLKDDGKPYTVFTPYSRKWKAKLNAFYLRPYPVSNYLQNLQKHNPFPFPSLESIGFESTGLGELNYDISDTLLQRYGQYRDYPFLPATSRVSIHLRFGTVSIRQLASLAREKSEIWLNELIWRDFYMMILWHFPHVVGNSFKPAYDRIAWRNNPADFERWCQGKTGYPIVDAGMRQLNETGFMHNRVRMVVASFLTKHLLIDWRWGEAYFAEKLLDFELASNNGGWQWAAGSGCDAAPYFRVFNPEEQTKKFDAEGRYIRKWVKEVDELSYSRPIVDHKFARERALKTYKQALGAEE
ncbi:MAG: DNA photolyase family protein [Bacteroidia bacterium]|nr:DNA photolyase family protein [Bacteroidia bacterium]